MKMKFIFVTAPGLESPHWHDCDAVITITNELPEQLEKDTIVFILAGIDNWQKMVHDASQSALSVIVMGRELKVEELNIAFDNGAHGYLELFATSAVIEQAVDTVKSDALWLPGKMLPNLVGALSIAFNQAPGCDLSVLSKREREVAAMASQGAVNKEIADSLFISERTVKQHLSSIFRKLGVKDRIQLMMAVKGS